MPERNARLFIRPFIRRENCAPLSPLLCAYVFVAFDACHFGLIGGEFSRLNSSPFSAESLRKFFAANSGILLCNLNDEILCDEIVNGNRYGRVVMNFSKKKEKT